MSESLTTTVDAKKQAVLTDSEPASDSGRPAIPRGVPKLTITGALKWIFSFPAMLATLLVGRVFYEARGFSVDPDLWWHIKVGDDILRTHHFPTTDSYSWTVAGHPWIAYEWLGEVFLALVNRLGGVLGLAAFLIGLSGLIMLALYLLSTVRGGNSKAGFISSVILCSLAAGSFTARPQMFGYLFLVFTLLILEKFRQGTSWLLWALPPIFLVWVNIHGSFVIGIGIVVVYLLAGLLDFSAGSVEANAWTAKQRLQLESALLMCLAVLPITPYGTQLAVYPLDMAFSQPVNVANVSEWRPMPFDLLGGKIFLGIVIVMFALQLLARFRWNLAELLLLTGGTAMACLHVRFILLFVPFCVPIFATMLAKWIPPYKRSIDKFAFNAVLMGAIAVAMIHYWPTRKSLDEAVAKNFPVAAVNHLLEHPEPGKLLNTYGFGGYLVRTGIPTFIDGRGDLYERGGVFGDYMRLTMFKPGGFSVLDRYGISACLLSPDEPLAVALLHSPEWQSVYRDETSVLVRRR